MAERSTTPTIPLYFSSVTTTTPSADEHAAPATTKQKPPVAPKPSGIWGLRGARSRERSKTDDGQLKQLVAAHHTGPSSTTNARDDATTASPVLLSPSLGSEPSSRSTTPTASPRPFYSFPRKLSPSPSRPPVSDHPPPPRRTGTNLNELLAPSTRERTSSTPTHLASSYPSNSSLSSMASSVGGRLASTAHTMGIKQKLGVAAGVGKEWGKKGTKRWEEWGTKKGGAERHGGGSGGYGVGSSSAASSSSVSLHSRNASAGTLLDRPSTSSPLGASDNPIRLPATILGVKVPNRTGVAFGVDLEKVVESTRLRGDGVYRLKDEDPVVGDEAKLWLPAVAVRCLSYLDEWGRKEEGIYRVPGSAYQIAQLRALFDAGMDIDLRELHPADLDPHTVASLFKLWLREIPDSLLSDNLESAVDVILTESVGFPASSAHFLGQRPAVATKGPGMVNGKAPAELLEKLKELFGGGMPAEHYFLLRSISWHLARLASHSEKNKMTLGNLRLILSPTLRLSPVMLLILVEEREIIFSKPNESAKLREAEMMTLSNYQSASSSTSSSSPDPNSYSRTSPRTNASPTFPASSSSDLNTISSTTTTPSPPETFLPAASSPPNPDFSPNGSWRTVDSSPNVERRESTATFGTDKFVTPPTIFTPTLNSLYSPRGSLSNGTSHGNRDPPPGPIIVPPPIPLKSGPQSAPATPSTAGSKSPRVGTPSTITIARSIRTNHSANTPSPPGSPHVASSLPVSGPLVDRARKMSLADAMAQQRDMNRWSGGAQVGSPVLPGPGPASIKTLPPPLRQWSDESKSSKGTEVGRSARMSTESGRPSNGSGRPSNDSGRPSVDSVRSGVSGTSSLSYSSASSNHERRPSEPPQLLTLPEGLGEGLGMGLGLGTDDSGEGGGWGLLSVEDRRRFFEST